MKVEVSADVSRGRWGNFMIRVRIGIEIDPSKMYHSCVNKQLGCDRQRYEKDFKRNPRKAEIDEILEIKRLTAWRTCKRAKSQMREPSSPHPTICSRDNRL